MRLGRRRAPREDYGGRLPAVRVQKQRGHLHVGRAQTHPGKWRGVGIKDCRLSGERVGVVDDVQVQRVPGEQWQIDGWCGRVQQAQIGGVDLGLCSLDVLFHAALEARPVFCADRGLEDRSGFRCRSKSDKWHDAIFNRRLLGAVEDNMKP